MSNGTKRKKRQAPKALVVVVIVLVCLALFADWKGWIDLSIFETPDDGGARQSFNMDSIPAYSGDACVVINDNVPGFTDEQKTLEYYRAFDWEYYGDLDSLGRCVTVYACVGTETMPTGERDFSLSGVKPTGWVNVQYPGSVVPGGWLYNRCHLIGWQLTAEETNEKNLITGTRYLNVTGDSDPDDGKIEGGMLTFENMVADYVKETGNHVAYRVTPVFEGNNLLASGVQMEGWSVEDDGEGICFNVYCYNVQPGIILDYATGESRLAE